MISSFSFKNVALLAILHGLTIKGELIKETDLITTQHLSMTEDTICGIFKPLEISELKSLYQKSPDEHQRLSSYFKIKKTINSQSKQKLVAYSLFWKPQEIVNQSTVHELRFWKDRECSFFDKYVSPLIKSIQYYLKHESKTKVRIYLAADLEFLIDQLLFPNVEIFLMESSSIGHSPGAMWRFLAISDPEAEYICCKDSDDKIKSEQENKINLWFNDPNYSGFYRIHSPKIIENEQDALYSPIQAGLFGAKCQSALDIESIMKGFILYKELNKDEPRHNRDKSYPMHPFGYANQMPSYGFDERFLKHVIYHLAASQGMLTTICTKRNRQKDYLDLLKQSEKQLRVMDYKYILNKNTKAIFE
jgi:hypothetical protein